MHSNFLMYVVLYCFTFTEVDDMPNNCEKKIWSSVQFLGLFYNT
jgi:hypothetical protein